MGLALQQLSVTALPSLIKCAKSSKNERATRAALECATTLLCSVPVEAACSDYKEDMRWCCLTGIKLVCNAAASNGSAVAEVCTSSAIFFVQVLQLLLRSCSADADWLESDLHSVIPHLTSAC